MTDTPPVPTAPDPAARLVDADREAALARQQLSATLTLLQARLSPRKLARDAAREAGVVGDVAGRAVTGAARRNPGAIAGAVAALALLLARKPIVRLIRRRRATDTATTSSAISEDES